MKVASFDVAVSIYAHQPMVRRRLIAHCCVKGCKVIKAELDATVVKGTGGGVEFASEKKAGYSAQCSMVLVNGLLRRWARLLLLLLVEHIRRLT